MAEQTRKSRGSWTGLYLAQENSGMVGKIISFFWKSSVKESIRRSQEAREKAESKLEELKATLDGEDGWGICLTKNGEECDWPGE